MRIDEEMRAALPVAMKARDRLTVGVLRSTLAAIDNASAIEPVDEPGSLAIEQIAIGAGATEAPRRELRAQDIEAVVRDEAGARLAAAQEYEQAGRSDRADALRAEAAVLEGFLQKD